MTAPTTPRAAAAPDAPWPGEAICITVLGDPETQGSKKPLGFRRTRDGRLVGNFAEDNENLPAWRAAVATEATRARDTLPWKRRLAFPLDGPLAVEMIFTLGPKPKSRPAWWPGAVRWSRTLMWRPASKPDLSKLLRAAEDALTGVLWKDDARVVQYDRLAKHYVGDATPDALDRPGVVIRIRQIGGGVL